MHPPKWSRRRRWGPVIIDLLVVAGLSIALPLSLFLCMSFVQGL